MTNNDTLIKNLIQFIQQNPKDINAWLSLARLIDDQKKKADCYKRVLQLDPENLEAREYLLEFTGEKNTSQSKNASSSTPSTIQPVKSKKSIKNTSRIWIGITLFGLLSIIAICIVFGFISQRGTNTPSSQATSPIPPSLYNQNAENYLPSIAEMPNEFEIRYEMEESGNLKDDAKTRTIGTFATRTFFIPDFQTNKINVVLYFIEVDNDVEDAKISYQGNLRNFSSPKPIKKATLTRVLMNSG